MTSAEKKKAGALRQANYRKRREADGLVLLQGIWVPKELLPAVRAAIENIIGRRN
ncbi:MAG: hypothetical protein LW623_10910 [Sphingomonadaceae bacterium]|jgi:hypothetical protein|uniref:hypothetical protein n=1 Tax=Sphingorhabdus sp. TaxID=1902408 RepID=UPI0039BC2AE6|nr:hypothetical protein [Sphingomonadaceae bacterium]